MGKPAWEIMKNDWKLKLYPVPKTGYKGSTGTFDRLMLLSQMLGGFGMREYPHGLAAEQAQMLSFFSIFKEQGEQIYKIASEFGKHLNKTKLDVSAKFLTCIDQVICIEFPECLKFKTEQGYIIDHAFVHASDNSDGTYRLAVSDDGRIMGQFANDEFESSTTMFHKHVSIVALCRDDQGSLLKTIFTYGCTFMNEEQTLEEAIEWSDKANIRAGSKQTPEEKDLIRFIVKSLLYITSGDPDLRPYKAPRPKTQNVKKIRRWEKERANQSLIDMTLVGYDFLKPREYAIGTSKVVGHFRWQPWGKNRSLVKLIWIDPHERHYGQAEAVVDTQDQT